MNIRFHAALLCMMAAPAFAAETVASVPDSELAAPWRKYWAANRSRCLADIETHRKTDVSHVMKAADGRILKNAACDVRQVSSFGKCDLLFITI